MNEQTQEQRLRNILDTSYDAFVGVDKDGVIIEWNQQAENIFGWSHDEAIEAQRGTSARHAAFY